MINANTILEKKNGFFPVTNADKLNITFCVILVQRNYLFDSITEKYLKFKVSEND